MVNKFTQKAQSALSSALKLAEELGHCYIGTEHLLLGLIVQKESIASRILVLRGASETKLRQSIIDYMGVGAQSDITSKDMTPRLQLIIESAAREAEKNGVRYVGTEHLLSAILNRRDCVGLRLLESQGISPAELRADIAAYLGSSPLRQKEGASKGDEQSKKSKKDPLLSYGRDLTALARDGKTDPVLCRQSETERLIRILCRRSKNNPCLIGEPGVGKTAVVEGLASRIISGNVPPQLLSKRIITLDISSMIAGAKFRGEFEDRIKGVIEEASRDPDVILFVDEMHVMVGAGAAEGAIDASNILKPALARGEIRMIGATTPGEYRTHIEKDPAFERRFQPVMLEEPDESESISILTGLRDRYESYHGVRISDEAIREAVRLSQRYIHDRFLPDKAIDLIDEAAAKLRLDSIEESLGTPSVLEELSASKEEAVIRGDIARAAEISAEERELSAGLPPALCAVRTASVPTLSARLVADIVSEQTGIPCQGLMLSDTKRLDALEHRLSERIIGQEAAVSAVASAIRRGRAGFGGGKRPSGSFLFLGDSGVGKTELCRALADILFESSDALIRIDMSEYMEKHSVSKLIGSPPGYVGYGEGGGLTERVRRHPYSVILLDEIEKAHPDVLHLLLQMLEDGRLTDSAGRVADLSSSIIIMTSNLISSREAVQRSLGFGDGGSTPTDLRSHPKLKELFRPELLGRIDEIVLFSPLGEAELRRIARLMLEELRDRSRELGIALTIEPEVDALLAGRCASLHRDLGARPMRREITEQIESPLAEYMISGRIQAGSKVTVSAEDDGLTFHFE